MYGAAAFVILQKLGRRIDPKRVGRAGVASRIFPAVPVSPAAMRVFSDRSLQVGLSFRMCGLSCFAFPFLHFCCAPPSRLSFFAFLLRTAYFGIKSGICPSNVVSASSFFVEKRQEWHTGENVFLEELSFWPIRPPLD